MGRTKGSIGLKLVRFLRHHRDLASQALPADYQHYLTERILATAWIEDAHYSVLLRATAEVMERGKLVPEPNLSAYEYMGRSSAAMDYADIYKGLLKKGDPKRTLQNLEKLYQLRHESKRAHVSFEGPVEASVLVNDPEFASDESCKTVSGLIWQTLHEAGAGNIKVQKTHCQKTGAPSCRWHATWAEARAINPKAS